MQGGDPGGAQGPGIKETELMVQGDLKEPQGAGSVAAQVCEDFLRLGNTHQKYLRGQGGATHQNIAAKLVRIKLSQSK